MSTIFFAVLAFFIFYKLSKQLGKIDEEEKNQIKEKLQQKAQFLAAQQAAVEQLRKEKVVGASSTIEEKNSGKILENLDEATRQNLSGILARCNISADFFVNGARSAFEMIIKAFAAGDFETLKFLLSDKIYSGFESAINQRKIEEKTLTTNVISIEKVEIISALLLENTASIAVKFVSKQINYITDKSGTVAEGRKDEIAEITDIWTFKRDLTSPNPNWVVSATSNS